jgi:oxygen-dependent protoporphyrinogen oxidase
MSFNSRKFSGRTTGDESMLRLFLGGFGKESILEKDNEIVLEIVTSELRRILGIDAAPSFSRIVRWRNANPQYLLGHRERMERIHAALAKHPGVYLAGSAYGGVGVPDCVAQAKKVAEAIAATRVDTRNRERGEGAG